MLFSRCHSMTELTTATVAATPRTTEVQTQALLRLAGTVWPVAVAAAEDAALSVTGEVLAGVAVGGRGAGACSGGVIGLILTTLQRPPGQDGIA